MGPGIYILLIVADVLFTKSTVYTTHLIQYACRMDGYSEKNIRPYLEKEIP